MRGKRPLHYAQDTRMIASQHVPGLRWDKSVKGTYSDFSKTPIVDIYGKIMRQKVTVAFVIMCYVLQMFTKSPNLQSLLVLLSK